MSGVTRDFSQQSVQELRDIIRKNLQDNQWGFFDWFDDTFLMQELNIKNYINNVNEYHAKMIDKHNMGSAEFDRILQRVHTVDENYSARINSLVDQAKALQTRIEQLTKMIDPSVITANPGDFARLADGIDSKYQKVKVQSDAKMKQCEASMPVLYDKQWYENVADFAGKVGQGAVCGTVDFAKGLVQGVVDTANGIDNCYQKMLAFTKDPNKKFAEWGNYLEKHPFGFIQSYINFQRELPSFLSNQVHKSADDFAKADLKTKSEMVTQGIENLLLFLVPEAKIGTAGEAVELGGKVGSAAELAGGLPKIEKGTEALKDIPEIEKQTEAIGGAEKAAGIADGEKTVKAIEQELKHLNTGNLKIIKTRTPLEANMEWLSRGYDKLPYDMDYEVKIVEAGDEGYVRVFSYNADGTSNKIGGWIMRKRDIEGLTPAQIAEKYALPQKPTHICDVMIKPECKLQVGIANKVDGWGMGGGMQFDTLGKKLPQSSFINERCIGG